MPEIFSGTSVPSWLQEDARPADMRELGHDIGTIGAGLFNMLGSEPVTDPKTGQQTGTRHPSFGEGIAEARLSQQDPMWRLKKSQLEAGISERMAEANSAWQSAEFSKSDFANWIEDQKNFADYNRRVITDPNTPIPFAKSTIGSRVRQQYEANALKREQFDIQKKKLELDTFNKNRGVEYDSAWGQAGDAAQSSIALLPQPEGKRMDEYGWILDSQGKRVTPDPRAVKIMNDALKAQGKPLYGQSRQAERNEGAQANIKAKADETAKRDERLHGYKLQDIEKTIEGRKELESIRQQGLKERQQGVDLPMDKFVDRSLNTLVKQIIEDNKNNNINVPVDVVAHAARKVLEREWEGLQADKKAATGSKPSAPIVPGGTKDNPLGLKLKSNRGGDQGVLQKMPAIYDPNEKPDLQKLPSKWTDEQPDLQQLDSR